MRACNIVICTCVLVRKLAQFTPGRVFGGSGVWIMQVFMTVWVNNYTAGGCVNTSHVPPATLYLSLESNRGQDTFLVILDFFLF